MDVRIIRGAELSEVQLDNLVADFLAIRDKVLPPRMKAEYADGEQYYRQQLLDSSNIVVCHFNAEGHAIGYVAAVPHSLVYAELKEHDFQLEDDLREECYYIENIASIAEQLSAGKALVKLINELIREADRRGRKYITMHVRIENGLADFISAFFPVEVIRIIPNWYYTDEPAYYLIGYLDRVKWLKRERAA